MRNEKIYIKDMLDAVRSIESFVEGFTITDFTRDDKTASAVFRKFEIIGEAAKKIGDPLKLKYAEVPWKEMAGMRDRLIHFYFGINHDIVWETIRTWLPKIRSVLEMILAEWPGEGASS